LVVKLAEKAKGHIHLTLKNQGGFIVGLILIFYGYYGIICNTVMYYVEGTISFQYHKSEWLDGHLIVWSYQTYIQTLFMPAALLFLLCFFLTYKEDIPYYGIKSSIWFVPITIVISIIWYWVVHGISMQPLILLFAHPYGYLNMFIIFALNLSGSLAGMKIKQYVVSKRQKISIE
jgi:hypothetical protein